MDVDFTVFDKEIWPILANRVPAFDALKVCRYLCFNGDVSVCVDLFLDTCLKDLIALVLL